LDGRTMNAIPHYHAATCVDYTLPCLPHTRWFCLAFSRWRGSLRISRFVVWLLISVRVLLSFADGGYARLPVTWRWDRTTAADTAPATRPPFIPPVRCHCVDLLSLLPSRSAFLTCRHDRNAVTTFARFMPRAILAHYPHPCRIWTYRHVRGHAAA